MAPLAHADPAARRHNAVMLNHLKQLWSALAGSATNNADASVSEQHWQAAEARLHFLSHLSAEERQQLRALSLDFIQQKSWHGAQGFVITLEIQLEIALQACLLILKRDPHAYDGWVEIIIYPGDFIIPRQETDEAGVVHEYDDHVLGEAWEGGPLLLAWQTDQDSEGINVIIHEFAHKLDMATGEADGLPALPDAAARRRWREAFEPAYLDFCKRVDSGEDTAIDPYAAEAPAEFFAVLSEVFFEAPALLRQEYPAVYAELSGFYGQTP
jgi:MtfA peptidase